jgi:DNA-binding NtrC family response regulator
LPKFNPFNKGRVFIVDESILSSTLAAILRRQDFAVTAFADGTNALRASRTEPPDLLITDMALSPFTGIDLALRLRKRCPSCKVLFFSGQSGSAESLEIARSNGLEFELIPEPVDPTELIKKVRDVTEAASCAAAKDRALKTYNDNARETLSQLQAGSPLHFSRMK